MQVDDPSKYGVVVTDEASKVERFVEKPKACFSPTYCRHPLCLHMAMDPVSVTAGLVCPSNASQR